jgi:hypothetical protein
METERAAAEFLLLDRLFPRSVVFALNRAEQCLDEMEPGSARAGFQDEAHRLIGRTRAELEYRSLADVVADLPEEMDQLQRTCAAATGAISRKYFAGAEAVSWKGGAAVSMQMRVVHTTEFEYDGLAAASYNQARMTPVTAPGQIVVHTRLAVHPKPWTSEYRDYFGSHVITFEVLDPHDAMSMVATSTVQVARGPVAEPTTPWEEYADRAIADRWTEYLTLSDLVIPPPDFADARCAPSPPRARCPVRPRGRCAGWSTRRSSSCRARPTSGLRRRKRGSSGPA